METEESASELPPALAVTDGWQTTLFIGAVTLVLGVIVAVHPSSSLNVIAVLLGVLLIVTGLFHLIRALTRTESRRVWPGIAGLLLVVIGVVLIRHLHLTVALMGLIVGVTWIVQGVSALAAGLSISSREGRGWWIFFGVISLVGGVVVAATPTSSVTVIATLIGIWFIVQGVLEIIAAFMLRRGARKPEPARTGEGAAAR